MLSSMNRISSSPPVIELTALIPVLNRPHLVQEAIASVLQNSLLPQELIVVLSPQSSAMEKAVGKTVGRGRYPEGSHPKERHPEERYPEERYPDRWAVEQAFRRFSSSPTELRSLFCPRPGVSVARNCGIAAARWPWIALLDSDDLWSKNKLEQQWQYLKKRPHLQGCYTEEIWLKKGQVLRQPLHLRPRRGRFLKASLSHCLISTSAAVIRKDVMEEIGGYNERFPVCEDFDLWLRWLLRYPMGLVAKPLVIKRSGDWPQLSKNHSLDAFRIEAICKLVQEAANQLQADELQAANSACRKKFAILTTGAKRHGSLHKLEGLRELLAQTFESFPAGL